MSETAIGLNWSPFEIVATIGHDPKARHLLFMTGFYRDQKATTLELLRLAHLFAMYDYWETIEDTERVR